MNTTVKCEADGCEVHSEEYGALPSCRDCGGHCCPAHVEPGTLNEEAGRCQCKECHAGGAQ